MNEKPIIIWMPHAGHFICGNECQFHLNTYVNGYIVSTVGEYKPDSAISKHYLGVLGVLTSEGFKSIGADRLYETMVFHGRKSQHDCCPYEMTDGEEVDFEGYNTPGDAYRGHLRMVAKYAGEETGGKS